MGGHTQFGEFKTFTETKDAFYGAFLKYRDGLGLTLDSVVITYERERNTFILVMRFVK